MKPDVKKYCRDQTAAYREQSDGICEVSHLLRRCEHFRKWESNHCYPGLAVHHLWGRMGMESHSFCCLILVSTSAHEWSHQAGGLPYNVSHAFEACCLIEKNNLHWDLWNSPDYGNQTPDKYHWWEPLLNAARSICVSHKTLASRVEFLSESLSGSIWGDVTTRLLEVCCA